MQKTMIIVGAGISGLSTGCYAQMNGYKTTIFEAHNVPGGLCAAWTRKGYTFDVSMHITPGTRRGPFKQIWDELGVTRNREFYYHNSPVSIEGNGEKLDLCLNRTRLEKQMLAISPEDAVLIKEFINLFFGRSIIDLLSLDPPELTRMGSKIKMAFSMIPLIGILKKYAKVSLQEFAARFKNPFLARAIRSLADTPGWPMPRYPMVAVAGFSQTGSRDSGYPLGGSMKVAHGIADYYQKLGGEMICKSRVKNIIIENDTAVGVQMEDGSEHRADIVVWAADGHKLIFDILKEKYISENIRKMYKEWIPVKPIVHVMFGVNMDLSREPQKLIYRVDKPITVGGEEFKWIHIMMHCFDKSTAPVGKSALEVWYATDYSYWENLIKDRAGYDFEKKRIADETADALEKRWPGFKSKIEVVDVPTPMTYVRYTDNWQGSPDGWYITVDNMMDQSMRRTLPGLKNLYMVGQWTAPFTGTLIAALSGRQLIQILCRNDRKPFARH